MVSGCVGSHGMGYLHICEGNINADRCMQVLEHVDLDLDLEDVFAKSHSAHYMAS